MFEVILYQPEIPPNTGNAIRLCANSGCRLHLVEPLGFALDEPKLRRAGLDYHEWAEVRTWPDLAHCLQALGQPRVFGFSSHARRWHTEVEYRSGDALLFGPETRGLPQDIREELGEQQLLRLPMRPGNRSLNLSNSVAIAVYEAWRQCGFAGATPSMKL